jgi:eukaryotic-like serine/threonine-protein kinase
MIAETISHYRVLSQVGGTDAGAVFAAEDPGSGRRVAIKFLPRTLENPAALAEFERENGILCALNHPNICANYEIGEAEGRHFVAMELLEGATLKRTLTGQPPAIEHALAIAIQIAEALRAAHSQGVVHRDLRLANLFLTNSGQLKILNFGVASAVQEKKGSLDETTRGITATASQGGSQSALAELSYISPEQARGRPLDERSDLFCLGTVIYAMVTGTVPFRGDTPALVFDSLLNRVPVAPVRLNPRVPLKLQATIQKLLEKKRDLRYQRANDVLNDLKQVQKDLEVEASAAVAPLTTTAATHRARSARLARTLSAAGLALAVLAGVAFLYMKRERALTEKDAILLTDFVNTTADPVWDVTLKKAVAVDLEQSPYLNVFPEAKARQTLRFMGRAPDDRITLETGREICQRAGVKAVLAGTIANLGSQYVLSMQALNAATGDVLARAEASAARKTDVLNALHKADSELRGKLGESLASIQKYDKMLSEATTPSLEALDAFTLGDAKHAAGDEMDAIPHYQRAIALDPNFATAYARLGTAYNNLGQTKLSEQNRKQAFDLRDRASEREKLYIMSHYYADSGQYDKGITALELYEQTYPRDSTPANNLSNIYNLLGQYENALDKARKAVDLEPDSISGYFNLSLAYAGLNRMAEAKATAQAGLNRVPHNGELHWMLAGIAWNQNDAATLEGELQATENCGPSGKLMALSMRAALAAGHGQFRQMRSFVQAAQQAAAASNLQEAVAADDAQRASWEALAGFQSLARQSAERALKASASTNVALNSAITLALLHTDQRALKIADDASVQRPYDTLVQFVTIPLIKSVVAINVNQPAKAIDLLDGAMVYARSNYGVMYARGLAYLQEKKGTEAAQEFQRIIDSRSVFGDPLSSLARLGLGRAYALQGDRAKSRMAYQDLLALWKDADPDVPLLKQAKLEYSRVQ